MDLDQLRALVGNLADYDPNTTAYNAGIDRLINNTVGELFTLAPWSFAQREAQVKVHADAVATDGATTSASKNITTTAAFFDKEWMEGQVIEISGKEYEVTQVASTTSAYVKTAVDATATGVTFTVKHRYVDLPSDCVAVLQVGRYERLAGDDNEGRTIPLTRYEGDFHSLSLAQTGRPTHWLPYDGTSVRGPALSPTLSTVAGTAWAAGDYYFKVSHKYAYRYSAPQSADLIYTSDGVTAVQPRITLPNNGTGSGYRYAIWCKPPGYDAYRLFADDQAETGGTFTLTPGPLTIAAWQFQARMNENGGHYQRIRLYPRQDTDAEYTVRYVFRPALLIEAQDTPELPEPHHHVISEMALADLYARKDNLPQSRVYAQKAEKSIAHLRSLYLTETPKRWVKGGWSYWGDTFAPRYSLTHIG